MKSTLLILCTFIVSYACSQVATPSSISLNGTWKFRTDPYSKGESLNWFTTGLGESSWDSLPVPGNWDLRNEYASYTGKAWYRKDITVSPEWKGKFIRLLFEAVNGESKVWLNGRLLGGNNIGYLPFGFDVSAAVNYGSKNTLVVLCDNTSKIGALWNWGGIRRPVELVAADRVYISGQQISSVIDLARNTATVSVRVTCENTTATSQSISGHVLLSGPANYVKTLPFNMVVNGGAKQDVWVTTSISGKNVHLWNCDDPFLYSSKVYLKQAVDTSLQVADRFGLRKIEIDNRNFTFKLNGQSLRVMGFNLIPDDRTTGNTLPLWRIKQDIDIIKSFGANLARLTHVPLHREMFDYLDEKGILVFSEIPLWGLSQLTDTSNPAPKQWLDRLVANNYNHPCIIGWSVGNEIGHSPGVLEYTAAAIAHVRSLDSIRPGVVVSHTATRIKDPVQYSYPGLINNYGTSIGSLADTIHQRHPDKILFYSEFGYGQLKEDLDGDADARGMMDSIRFRPFLMGGALWTFNDYRSSYVGNRAFSENRSWGIVDVFRQKKKAWYSFRKEYAPVRELNVESDPKDINIMQVSIGPRKLLDLPAYPLKDYTLVWQGFDEQDKLKDGGFFKLPVINPGDEIFKKTIQWQNVSALSYLKIEILSPGNYAVYDTLVCLKKPLPPQIVYTQGVRSDMNDTFPNSGAIRVVFNGTKPGFTYKVKYGLTDLLQESAATMNNYIDITRLPYWKTYKVAVVAINSAGESAVQDIKQVRVEPGLPPPVITYTEPAEQGFYVGYITEKEDYLFKIQYTQTAGDYSNATTFQSATKGVLFVPGLENGKKYYFRMCRIKHNNYITPWSEEHTIIPDGGQAPATPEVQGVLRSGNEAMFLFEPVRKAIGYVLEYRLKQSGEWKAIRVNASELRHYKITALKKREIYEFRMASVNEYKQSAFIEAPVISR